jgi:hypothetical protein
MKIHPLIVLLLASGAIAQDAPSFSGPADCRIANQQPSAGDSVSWNGACKDGYAQGPGALQWQRGGKDSMRYEGNMIRGAPHGSGIALYEDTSRYEGEFKLGVWHGQGAVAYADGGLLIGRFQDGKTVGAVQRIYSNGDRYEGYWEQAGPQGEGLATFVTGGSYYGRWHRGEADGEGEIRYPNGVTQKGIFRQDFQLGISATAEADERDYNSASPLKKYAIKTTDSPFRRDFVTGLVAPANLPYGKLTEEQKLAVKRSYPLLQANDEPPYPIDGPQQIFLALSYGMDSLEATGDVELLMQIDEQGNPVSAKVFKAVDKDMGLLAAQILMASKFKAALCAGQPCAMGIRFRYRFKRQL